MADSPFARCQQFLDYHPVAKWFSILCSIGTAVLYLVLVVLLGFFIDLMVERGQIPSFHQLPPHEQQRFLSELALPDDATQRNLRVREVQDELTAADFDATQVRAWARGDAIENLSSREVALLWWGELPRFMDARVSASAGDKIRGELRNAVRYHGAEAAPYHALGDNGLLSLVVRTRSSYRGTVLAHFASWNGWMWAYGNSGMLIGLFIAALVVTLLRLVLRVLANYLGALAVIEAMTRFRRAIYHQTNRLGTLAFRALGPGEAVSISARHLEVVHDGLYQWLTIYFREPVKIGLLVTFTLVVNFWLALAFLLFALLVWLVGGQVAAYFRRRSRVAQRHAADQLVLIQESLMLMRLIKVYLMEAFNQTRVERQLSAYARAQLARYWGDSLYLPVFFFLGLFACLALLLVAGFVILSGNLGVTSTLVLAVVIISLYLPVIAFLEARRVVRRARESAQVVFDFLDRHGGVGQAIEAEFIPPLADTLEFDKVSLKEPGSGRKLLTDISFTLHAGEKLGIVGPDDMEKHALVYLLPRFLDPTNGEIKIDGKSLRWVTLESLRVQIAIVLQNNLVFNDTIANNIGCGEPSFNIQRIMEAAKIAHAHQFISKLPQGYETVIGEMGHPLKLGEMFRIALARAIIRDPAVIVIEEPTTPLDDDTKGIIDDTLNRFLPGRTVIFLPHRISTIRNCDQVLLLYQGQIDASGTHRELLENSELYRHLQYMEFNEYASLVMPVANARPPEPAQET